MSYVDISVDHKLFQTVYKVITRADMPIAYVQSSQLHAGGWWSARKGGGS
jgi:hypothetical protein